MQIQRLLLTNEGDGERTPVYEGRDPFEILRVWKTRLSGLGNLSPELDRLEEAETAKFGPYFIRPFPEWQSSLEAYFNHERKDFTLELPDLPFLEEGVNLVVSEITSRQRGSKLKPLDIQTAYERSRKGTNFGFPDATSDKERINLGYYIRRASDLVSGKEAKLYPFILFRRVQPGGPEPEDAKQRPVWGADHAETIALLTVLYAVLDEIRSIPGFEHLEGVDALEASVARHRGKTFISGDFSRMDATFGPVLQLIGFRILSDSVDCDPRLLQQAYQYYSEGEILTPVGIMSGVHGLPSGVALTNLLETLTLRAISYASMLNLGVEGPLWNNGDDLLLGLGNPEEQIVERFGEYFKQFNLVWNDSKSEVGLSASYLQRHFLFDGDFSAVMSTVRMLNRILYAERVNQSAIKEIGPRNFWTLNTIVKLENCKRHPHFKEFVDFVKAGDAYGLDPQEILGVNVSELLGYDPIGSNSSSSYGNNGLMEFETVRYLLSS